MKSMCAEGVRPSFIKLKTVPGEANSFQLKTLTIENGFLYKFNNLLIFFKGLEIPNKPAINPFVNGMETKNY